MFQFLYIIVLVLFAQSCGHLDFKNKNRTPVDIKKESFQPVSEWQNFQNQYFNKLWSLDTNYPAYLGHPKYEFQLKAYDHQKNKTMVQFYQKYLALLKNYKIEKLNSNEKIEHKLLQNGIESSIWYSIYFKSYETNPSHINAANVIGEVWNSSQKSTDQKLELISLLLENVPAYYEASFAALRTSSKEHLNLAIKQNKGSISFLNSTFNGSLLKTNKSIEFVKKFNINLSLAVQATEKHVENLESMNKRLKKNNSFKSFRISKKEYAQKFKFEMQTVKSADQIYQSAIAAKKQTHQKMFLISEKLWPKYFPGIQPPKDQIKMTSQLIEKISLKHSTVEEILPNIRKQIPELWNFVLKKDLMTLDESQPLEVRETPIYKQGFAGASVDSPGIFEVQGKTYYNVTPPTQLSKERQESYLREYNDYMMKILNIHEAIPGHYVQLVYSNKNSSLVKKLLQSGTMMEGWAVYTERMMLEEGFGNQEPELWLMYYKWFLRVTCNTILDYSIHNLNMTKVQAEDLLMNQAFQERTEFEEKWNRATYSQVQLSSYFAGFTEIYDYREKLKKKLGSRFSLKKFHEKFLSYGSIPVKMIIELMDQEGF